MQSLHTFEKKIEERGKNTIAGLDPDQKAFVLISKIYGIADPTLNLGIPDTLEKMGYQTLPFYDMPEVNIFSEHPNMYWPFGQHILEAAKLVGAHPNLYAIFLTHHGCGPDTVTAHYFREFMGNKPYLTIEVDEHSSDVGAVTRVEAFVNSLDKRPVLEAGSLETYTKIQPAPPVNIMTKTTLPQDGKLILPRLYPFSDLACKLLKSLGHNAIIADETTAASLDIGRHHTVTNEYYSLAALLGDMLHTLKKTMDSGEQLNLLLPQNEGAEVDGQYARFIRTILNENGMSDIGVISPFMEDLLHMDENRARTIFLCVLAGDLALLAPRDKRQMIMETLDEITNGNVLCASFLNSVARHVCYWLDKHEAKKTIFALGEPMTLYSDMLNDNTFKTMEEAGHRVVYAPLSEYMWSFWRDYAPSANGDKAPKEQLLCEFQAIINVISETLGRYSHFEPNLEQAMQRADTGLGFYAGAFGRYRSTKPLGNLSNADGIIQVTSMYENTGISLDILNQDNGSLPSLTMTFDGNKNENDRTKTESFIHYL